MPEEPRRQVSTARSRRDWGGRANDSVVDGRQAVYPVDIRPTRISIDPKIMVGKPCIKGTRITVEHILRQLAGGMTPAEIVEGHPRLTGDDVAAAQAFAASRPAVRKFPPVSRNLTRFFARQISGTLTSCGSSTTDAAHMETGLAISTLATSKEKDPGYSTREEKARRIPGSVGQRLSTRVDASARRYQSSGGLRS